MLLNISGLLTSRKTPGAYFAVILGSGGASAGSAGIRGLIVGNKITSDITAASPSFTVTAGTQANATPIQLFGPDDAATLFGYGSELHRMAIAFFAQFPDGELWACAVAESGGSRASAVYTFVTTATAACTFRLRIAGKTIDVAINSGDTVTTIATNIATAILAVPSLPVTAQFSAGVLTITAKHPGPRGNALPFVAYFVPSSGRPVKITTSSTSSGAGTTCTLSGNGTNGSIYTMSGGTTADDVTAALAALATNTYHRQAFAHVDSTNLALISTQMNSMAGVLSQRRQQSGAASNASAGTVNSLANTINGYRVQAVWHRGSTTPPEEVEAQVMAARLRGSGVVGIDQSGEINDPACNLDGMTLATVEQQIEEADKPTDTQIEAALAAGVTPLVPTDGGKMMIARSVITHTLTASQPDYSVFDTTDVTVPDFVADDLRSQFVIDFRAFKLAPVPSDGEFLAAPKLTHAGLVRAWIKSRLKTYEARGILREVDDRDSQLVVAENGSVAGRLDAEIPTVPVPGLHIFGANVRQQTPRAS